ncbi:hypothetical protein PR202_ga13190 [Eleusine coracana subsp. coracana]|uniref:Plantacyanin n=1 Tax=Eleusine coracana subsp. coracana TaxID=191504 RepID=A0AAV5CDL9_ELECO|nr:hypothetical protein QOZ80_3AG0219320 [Eleusine coracana subsp. coracana]GJM96363.1 hypothetical protein PR202_ga13190 [Eleusine coracana subsp. coracana]
MAGGRGSASARRAIAVAFAVAICCCTLSDAATTYYVGDGSGWSFSSASWPNGKQFHAGDILVFRYIPWIHNVVAVDEDGYNGCTTPPGSRTYTSGSDSVRLARGNNYFICTRFGHCNLGMKLVVNAA